MRPLFLAVLAAAAGLAIAGSANADDDRLCAKATGDVRIEACTRVIKSGRQTAKDLSWALNNRANAYARKGELDRAIADYDEIVRVDPTDATAFFNRGIVYQAKNNFDRAVADLNEAIRLNPKDASALYGRCWLRATAGKELAQALADCDQSLLLRPNHHDTLDSRGLVYFRLGRFDQAIADLDAALSTHARSVQPLYVRGLAKMKKGDAAGGEADIAAAEMLYPKIAEHYAQWGVRR
jgi:tetratricopeptide (TPR) repeat protein